MIRKEKESYFNKVDPILTIAFKLGDYYVIFKYPLRRLVMNLLQFHLV